MIRIVLIILTAIFMFAAGGKLWLVATDPFADIKLGFPLSVIWLAIAVEFALSYVNLRTILRPPPQFSYTTTSMVSYDDVRGDPVGDICQPLGNGLRIMRLFRSL